MLGYQVQLMDLTTMRFSVGCRQSIQQNNVYFLNSKRFFKGMHKAL